MEMNTVCLNVILVFTNYSSTDELEKGLSVLQLSELITHFRKGLTPNVKLFMRRIKSQVLSSTSDSTDDLT